MVSKAFEGDMQRMVYGRSFIALCNDMDQMATKIADEAAANK